MLDRLIKSCVDPAARCRECSHNVRSYVSVSLCLTPVNQSLPLSGPSSPSPGSPVGTHGRVLGLKIDVRNK